MRTKKVLATIMATFLAINISWGLTSKAIAKTKYITLTQQQLTDYFSKSKDYILKHNQNTYLENEVGPEWYLNGYQLKSNKLVFVFKDNFPAWLTTLAGNEIKYNGWCSDGVLFTDVLKKAGKLKVQSCAIHNENYTDTAYFVIFPYKYFNLAVYTYDKKEAHFLLVNKIYNTPQKLEKFITPYASDVPDFTLQYKVYSTPQMVH